MRILEPSDLIVYGGAIISWIPLIIENFSTLAAGLAATVATILGILKICALIGRRRDERPSKDPSDL